MAKTSYAVALGSNRRHGIHGAPAAVVAAAAAEIDRRGLAVDRLSTVRTTPALGPAGRDFANAALILRTHLDPPALLAELKAVERSFGRRPGRRWGPRVIDLDIILWSEGCWADGKLTIPHPAMRERRFVIEPLAELVPGWRDPISGATMRQTLFRHAAARPVDPASPHP
jgi:2-amino-4-hydroxy-6-hydroxymethyldihydropteridine diphosphokinase